MVFVKYNGIVIANVTYAKQLQFDGYRLVDVLQPSNHTTTTLPVSNLQMMFTIVTFNSSSLL